MPLRECELCGFVGPDVLPRLVAWADTTDRRQFDWLTRCRDDATCRARVEARGERWLVKESCRPVEGGCACGWRGPTSKWSFHRAALVAARAER